MSSRASFSLWTLALGAVLFACTGPRNVATENDRLRARILELEDEIATLDGRNRELTGALAEARAERDAAETTTPDVRAHVPLVVGITLGRLSHAYDASGDEVPDTLRLYVKPSDGLGRFVQLAGRLDVNIARLPADAPAEPIMQVQLSPGELRAAYRSGFGGTHYTIEVPLPPTRVRALTGPLDVRVFYTDGRTGQTVDTHRTIEIPARSE
jgi:hypothetical protein